jgi:hypothetical protein
MNMRLLVIAVSVIVRFRAAGGELKSPDGQYEIEYFKALPHESNVRIKNAKTGKVLGHAFSNGYEQSSYLECPRSPKVHHRWSLSEGSKCTTSGA